jgi:acetyl-CoA C-acetyltransferase
MTTREIVLCTPLRTALSNFGGSLKSVPATELGAVVVRGVLGRTKSIRRTSARPGSGAG